MVNERKKFTNYDPNAPFHTFKKFKMYAKAQGENKVSVLSWGCRDGNPRIDISTNIESDKVNKSGMISAAFNPETFFILLDYLRNLYDAPNDTAYKFECKTTTALPEGGRSEPFVASSVWVGKDNEGKVWISVLVENRPKIKFIFMISNYHNIHEKGKGPISEEHASRLQARVCANMLENAYYKLISDFTTSESKRVKKDSDSFNNENTTVTTSSSSDLNFDDIQM